MTEKLFVFAEYEELPSNQRFSQIFSAKFSKNSYEILGIISCTVL